MKADDAAARCQAFHVCLVAGARPNFMKVAPILRAIRKAEVCANAVHLVPHLVHTGQHYDAQLSDVFFRDLNIEEPEANLGVGSGSHAEQTAAVMVAFEQYCESVRPDVVMVVGDVNSTLACSIVAAKAGIRLAHVEAGLRSFDRTMPEEINRVVTDSLSDLLFVSEESGLSNLRHEGVPEGRVHFVGNVMIDTLLNALKKLDGHPALAAPAPPYGLVTLHRPSNVDDRQALTAILRVLCELAGQVPLILPLHPRTRARLKEFGLEDHLCWRQSPAELDKGNQLYAVPPLGYMEFLTLMRRARIVLTDSGGVQEETTALGVPCITLRENTERPVTVTMGTNYLVGTDVAKIRAAFAESLTGGRKGTRVPPLWDGKAAERIVDVLHQEAQRRLAGEKS